MDNLSNQHTPYAPPEAIQLEQNSKLCFTCNVVIHEKAEICPKCGVRQRKPASKLTLLLLTLFMGSWGVHRFYLGHYLWGILYLLFFWTFIPALISWVEYIIFILKSRESIEDNYDAHDSAVAIVIAMPVFLLFVAIIAGITIPAYIDYMNKIKVAEVMGLFNDVKEDANTYIQDIGKFPSTADLESQGAITSGLYIANIVANPQRLYLQATMRDDGSTIAGKTIRLTFEPNSGKWKCSSGYPNGINNKYLPRHCRKK